MWLGGGTVPIHLSKIDCDVPNSVLHNVLSFLWNILVIATQVSLPEGKPEFEGLGGFEHIEEVSRLALCLQLFSSAPI